jgi:hypothetical protein
MTPKQFNELVEKLRAANPEGVPVDEFLDLIVTLVESAMADAYGMPSHATLLVGERIEEVKVATSLSDKQLHSLSAALCEVMALKLGPTAGKAS